MNKKRRLFKQSRREHVHIKPCCKVTDIKDRDRGHLTQELVSGLAMAVLRTRSRGEIYSTADERANEQASSKDEILKDSPPLKYLTKIIVTLFCLSAIIPKGKGGKKETISKISLKITTI